MVQLKKAEGFTLIELILVIAILAIITVVGIHSYANLKEIQAKKMNLAEIKQTQHALETYQLIRQENGDTGYFNGFDSLIDAQEGSGVWTGTAGTFKWTGNLQSESVGIYDGSWKHLRVVKNALGQGGNTPPTLAAAKEQNKGTSGTGLTGRSSSGSEAEILGIHFLTTAEATLLANAGITWDLLHNASTAQATTYASTTNVTDINSYAINGGGPGFRADMSAYYPQVLTNGSPVAVINPINGASIYKDLGYAKASTNDSSEAAATALVSGQTDMLVAFGIGKSAQCVISNIGLGEAPVNPFYNQHYYRYYLAIFVISTRGQGTASTCHFAGILDCSGNTYRAAEYAVSWTTKLN